jgi:DnaK suppressor protein
LTLIKAPKNLKRFVHLVVSPLNCGDSLYSILAVCYPLLLSQVRLFPLYVTTNSCRLSQSNKDYARREKRDTILYHNTCATKGYKWMAIDLAVMKKRLEAKQAELQQHIATLIGNPTQPEDSIQARDGVVEPEEEAVDLEESDVDQAILNNEKTLLVEVQQALARIDNGTYGICSNCGQPIPEKRLEAIPWATLCVTCESKLGTEG